MCASPIQYSRDFIIEIKEGKKSNITQNKTLINTLINEYFLANLKIIEKNAVDNMPTHNNYKGNKGNYGKKKTKYFAKDKMRVPAKRPVTFLNKVGEKSDEIMKNVNGNLNKLSNQNYDKIWENIQKIYTDNKDEFDYIAYVESIFDKATMQPTYCPLYVKLCNDMIAQLKEIELDEEFTKLITDKCEGFKKMIQEINDTEDDVLNVSDYEDFCAKNKQRIYKKGFSQFIGELYKSEFLDGPFLEDYVKALVDNTVDTLNKDDTNVENNIICFQQLIDTCFNYRELQSKSFFENIKVIKDHKNLPKKLKFKMMDILHC
jgi:translation initiation factor 4G